MMGATTTAGGGIGVVAAFGSGTTTGIRVVVTSNGFCRRAWLVPPAVVVEVVVPAVAGSSRKWSRTGPR